MTVEKVLSIREVKEPQKRYERTEKSGKWRFKPDKSIVWEETTTTMKFDVILHDWVKTETKTEELSPEQSPFKLAKEMIADAIFIREKDDDESQLVKQF